MTVDGGDGQLPEGEDRRRARQERVALVQVRLSGEALQGEVAPPPDEAGGTRRVRRQADRAVSG